MANTSVNEPVAQINRRLHTALTQADAIIRLTIHTNLTTLQAHVVHDCLWAVSDLITRAITAIEPVGQLTCSDDSSSVH